MIRFYQRQNDMAYKNILKSVHSGNGTLHLIKIETTGLNPEHDEICGIRCVKLSLGDTVQKTGVYNALVRTNVPIPEEASRISGITQDMIRNGKSPEVMLQELNAFLGQNAYICGFNTKGFLYPFLFGTAKRCGTKICALGGFDLNSLARTVILPDHGRRNDGYGAKTLCDLFGQKNGICGYVTVLSELYKRISLTSNAVPGGYVTRSKYVANKSGKYIVFTVADGLILLNCDTEYFEDHGNVFDKVDMDQFTEYVLNKTKSSSISELIQKLTPGSEQPIHIPTHNLSA